MRKRNQNLHREFSRTTAASQGFASEVTAVDNHCKGKICNGQPLQDLQWTTTAYRRKFAMDNHCREKI